MLSSSVFRRTLVKISVQLDGLDNANWGEIDDHVSSWLTSEVITLLVAFLSLRKVLVLKDPRGPIFKSSSLDIKSSSLSLKLDSSSLSLKSLTSTLVARSEPSAFVPVWYGNSRSVMSAVETRYARHADHLLLDVTATSGQADHDQCDVRLWTFNCTVFLVVNVIVQFKSLRTSMLTSLRGCTAPWRWEHRCQMSVD